MPDGSREFLAAAAGVKTGMEYEDVLMRNQKLAAENARLRGDMKQILGICSGIQDSYTRLLLIRDVASKSPHGE